MRQWLAAPVVSVVLAVMEHRARLARVVLRFLLPEQAVRELMALMVLRRLPQGLRQWPVPMAPTAPQVIRVTMALQEPWELIPLPKLA